jgi:hypothetical protein
MKKQRASAWIIDNLVFDSVQLDFAAGPDSGTFRAGGQWPPVLDPVRFGGCRECYGRVFPQLTAFTR